MCPLPNRETGPFRWFPVTTLFALSVILLAIGGVLVRSWPRGSERSPEIKTLYRNARPGVRYVGDAACTRCHSEIASTYRQHSMGRSLSPIEEARGEIKGKPGSQELFEAQGFKYSLESRGGRTFHRETRRDGNGKVI